MTYALIGRLLVCCTALGVAGAMAGELPAGWFLAGNRPAEYETGLDDNVVYRGMSIYLKSTAAKTTGFGTVMQKLDTETYRGKRVRISGLLRGANIGGWAGLWMRVDRAAGPGSLYFDNMQDRPITGSSDWTKCEVVLDVPAASGAVYMGMLLSGSGEVWLNELKIEPVPNTVATTDRRSRLPKEPQNLDFEK